MRTITRQDITSLLELFKNGLIGTAGNQMTQFCVQQAVHRVIDEDLENPNKSAEPPNWCVNPGLVSFGIELNDYHGWANNQARAKGLQKFAIAELGSTKIAFNKFREKLVERLKEIDPSFPGYDPDEESLLSEWVERTGYTTPNERLTTYANAAAEVLMQMGTDGGKFIHLVDEPNPAIKRHLAHKLGDKAYAAQQCSFGRCTPVTKAKM